MRGGGVRGRKRETHTHVHHRPAGRMERVRGSARERETERRRDVIKSSFILWYVHVGLDVFAWVQSRKQMI